MTHNPRTTDTASILRAVQQLAVTLTTEEDVQKALSAVDLAADKCIGHRLFTIMFFDAAVTEVERLYSSNPEAYPTGGRKQKRNTRWANQVLEAGKPFIGTSAADIQANFDDFQTISNLGLASVINIPLKIGGRVMGTMNLLNEANYYCKEDLETGWVIAGLACSVLSVSGVHGANFITGKSCHGQ